MPVKMQRKRQDARALTNHSLTLTTGASAPTVGGAHARVGWVWVGGQQAYTSPSENGGLRKIHKPCHSCLRYTTHPRTDGPQQVSVRARAFHLRLACKAKTAALL